jgi:hypothetical protein
MTVADFSSDSSDGRRPPLQNEGDRADGGGAQKKRRRLVPTAFFG